MSILYGTPVEDWIEENRPENGLFRAYWAEDGEGISLEDKGFGIRYEWYYKDGKQHGISKGWNQDGTLKHRMIWENDEKTGLYTRWFPNGQKDREGNQRKGGQVGLWKYWSPNGKESSELVWDGCSTKQDGVIKSWYYLFYEYPLKPIPTWFDNGLGTSMWKHERYKNGLRYELDSDNLFNGEDIVYHMWGEVRRISNYKNGKLHGSFTKWWPITNKWPSREIKRLQLNPRPLKGPSYPDWPYGKKYQERYFKDGKEDGIRTVWYLNGQKEWEEPYKDGELDGLVIGWHENGQKKSEETYKDGELDGLVIG